MVPEPPHGLQAQPGLAAAVRGVATLGQGAKVPGADVAEQGATQVDQVPAQAAGRGGGGGRKWPTVDAARPRAGESTRGYPGDRLLVGHEASGRGMGQQRGGPVAGRARQQGLRRVNGPVGCGGGGPCAAAPGLRPTAQLGVAASQRVQEQARGQKGSSLQHLDLGDGDPELLAGRTQDGTKAPLLPDGPVPGRLQVVPLRRQRRRQRVGKEGVLVGLSGQAPLHRGQEHHAVEGASQQSHGFGDQDGSALDSSNGCPLAQRTVELSPGLCVAHRRTLQRGQRLDDLLGPSSEPVLQEGPPPLRVGRERAVLVPVPHRVLQSVDGQNQAAAGVLVLGVQGHGPQRSEDRPSGAPALGEQAAPACPPHGGLGSRVVGKPQPREGQQPVPSLQGRLCVDLVREPQELGGGLLREGCADHEARRKPGVLQVRPQDLDLGQVRHGDGDAVQGHPVAHGIQHRTNGLAALADGVGGGREHPLRALLRGQRQDGGGEALGGRQPQVDEHARARLQPGDQSGPDVWSEAALPEEDHPLHLVDGRGACEAGLAQLPGVHQGARGALSLDEGEDRPQDPRLVAGLCEVRAPDPRLVQPLHDLSEGVCPALPTQRLREGRELVGLGVQPTPQRRSQPARRLRPQPLRVEHGFRALPDDLLRGEEDHPDHRAGQRELLLSEHAVGRGGRQDGDQRRRVLQMGAKRCDGVAE